jgi:hypothetical protein
VNLQRDNKHIDAGGTFAKRYEQLRLALRAYYQPNGEER